MAKMTRINSMGKISPSCMENANGTQIPHTITSDEKYWDEKYEMGKKLGEGSFGVVYEVVNRETGEHCACKIINKDKASHKLQPISREVQVLKKVQHKHVIQSKEIVETQQRIYLVMELCEGGELSRLVEEKGCLAEEDARIILQRLLDAIAYLHKKDFVHRDLKLENILRSRNPDDSQDELYIKVTDFGLSIKKTGNTADDMMDDYCGTPLYMAPEIMDNKTYSEKCDVWAIGVIMSYLLTGNPPFPTDSKSFDIKERFKEKQWRNISDEAKDCITRMLALDPAHRSTANEILDLAWMKGCLLSECSPPVNVIDLMKDFNRPSTDSDSNSVTNSDHSTSQNDIDSVGQQRPDSKTKPSSSKTTADGRNKQTNGSRKSPTSASSLSNTSKSSKTTASSATRSTKTLDSTLEPGRTTRKSPTTSSRTNSKQSKR